MLFQSCPIYVTFYIYAIYIYTHFIYTYTHIGSYRSYYAIKSFGSKLIMNIVRQTGGHSS